MRRVRGGAAVVAIAAAFAIGAELVAGDERARHWWANSWWTVVSAVAAIACAVTARRSPAGPRRAAWWWFAAGAASWFAGMLIWSTHELAEGVVTPFPSVADVLFNGIGPCFVAGCLRYGADRPSTALSLKQLGDLAVIGCVLVLVAALALYDPVRASSDGVVYVGAALAYPVLHGSALVFGLVIWWQHVWGARRWPLGLLLAGMALLAVVTTLYADSLLVRRYQAGAWIDTLWIACFALMTCAARDELAMVADAEPSRETPRDQVPATDALVPAVAVLIAVGAALLFRDRWSGQVVTVGGAAGVGLALALGLRLAASQRLERALRERIRRDEECARELQAHLLQAQRLHSIGALAGGVAHDFKNLLAVMIAGLALARRSIEKGEPANAHLDEIERSMWRAADLSARLLDLSRKRTTAPVEVDPGPLVATVVALLAKAMPSDVRLEYDEPTRAMPSIRVDPAGLEHALINLGLNARDALRGRGGTIRITMERRATVGLVGQAVVIRVDDDGPGIPAAVRPHLFEPFFTTKPPGEGTGLGLAMVEALAGEHGGLVRAEERPGGGARFELAFPAVASTQVRRPTSRAAVRGPAVLVVDASEVSRLVVTGALERSGYEAIVVATREAALAAAGARPTIAAVVADAATGLVGQDAIAALRAAGCTAPVVLVAATDAADAARSGDYAAVVAKPVDSRGLVAAVRAAVAAV
ncbi:MAG TPA: ATP-binding protein [Kofleriaceae bacterium]|nr:ATP-binding protein [Kofleriaceae bacterium]